MGRITFSISCEFLLPGTELFLFFSFQKVVKLKNKYINKHRCVYNFVYIFYVFLEFYFSILPSLGKYSVLVHSRQVLPIASPVL